MLTAAPAFALDPLLRAWKFAAFDELCARIADEWTPEPTSPGGWFGEVELTPVGAVPTVEI